jgi:hypothetical protein
VGLVGNKERDARDGMGWMGRAERELCTGGRERVKQSFIYLSQATYCLPPSVCRWVIYLK